MQNTMINPVKIKAIQCTLPLFKAEVISINDFLSYVEQVLKNKNVF